MSIAIEASNYIIDNINKDIIDYSLNNIFWPGRFEIINDNIILDGAHNIHAIKALCNTLKELNKKINIVYTSLKDKDYKSVINELDNIANKYYFTTIDDLRKEDPNIFKSLTNKESMVIENPFECVDYVINNANKDELILITGSLHFISIIREYLKNK
jgi:dihydrofolate synthase/folylpolyglutamate synthase